MVVMDAVQQKVQARAELARRLVEMAEPYYASAREGIDALPRRSAWAIATALSVYRRIGVEVVAKGPKACTKSANTKLRLRQPPRSEL